MTNRIAIAVVVLAACGPAAPKPVGPVPPTMEADRYATLQYAAGMQTGCPAAQLAYRKEGERNVFAGCDKIVMYEVFEAHTPTCTALAGWDAGDWCYESVPVEEAQFDLHCERSAITLTRLGSLLYGASGCGGRVRYQLVGGRWLADVAASQNP